MDGLTVEFFNCYRSAKDFIGELVLAPGQEGFVVGGCVSHHPPLYLCQLMCDGAKLCSDALCEVSPQAEESELPAEIGAASAARGSARRSTAMLEERIAA